LVDTWRAETHEESTGRAPRRRSPLADVARAMALLHEDEDEADRLLTAWLEDGSRSEALFESELWSLRAELDLRRGSSSQARASLRRARSVATSQGARLFVRRIDRRLQMIEGDHSG